MQIRNCRVNHFSNPLGFDLAKPRLSWTVEDCKGKRQAWARIVVSKNEDLSAPLYDSGEDASASSLAYELPIQPEACTRYFWKVLVKADSGETAQSGVNWFETAKEDTPWEAAWISCDFDTENPILFTDFEAPDEMEDLRAYVCGLGVHELYVNGEKAGREYLAPGANDYNEWLQYQTYELKFRKGKNRIELSLGNGWYKGRFGFNGSENTYGDRFNCILEIRQKGHLLLKTDESWQVRSGNIVMNNIYEVHWEIKDGKLCLRVLVPFYAEAEIVLPYGKEKERTVGAGTYEYVMDLPGEEKQSHAE